MDIVVVLCGALQLAALVYLVVAIQRVRNGPILQVMLRISAVMDKGRVLAKASNIAVDQGRERTLGLAADVRAITDAVRRDRYASPDYSITYQQIASAFATVRTARRYAGQASKLLRDGSARRKSPPRPAASPAVRAPIRRSIAERLGLIPPAAKHLGRVLPVLRMLLSVRKELMDRSRHGAGH